jgi:hypothetical protein
MSHELIKLSRLNGAEYVLRASAFYLLVRWLVCGMVWLGVEWVAQVNNPAVGMGEGMFWQTVRSRLMPLKIRMQLGMLH